MKVEVSRINGVKCPRCYKWGDFKASDYFLCGRCQKVLHSDHNSFCVSCGCNEAVNNLCDPCRKERIRKYDKANTEPLSGRLDGGWEAPYSIPVRL